MKILIISDSHSITDLQKYKILEKADMVIHLGDSQLQDDELSFIDIKVKGNCDYSNQLSKEECFFIESKKVFATHGDRYNDFSLVHKAKELNCDIVMHGHTHVPRFDLIDGIYVINPGSLKQSRSNITESYMIIENNHIFLKDAHTYKIIQEYEWILN